MHCNGSMLPIVQSFKVVLGQFGLQTVLKPLLTTAEHTTSVLKWNLQKAKKQEHFQSLQMRKFKFNLLTLRVLVSILLTKRSFLAGGGYWPCSSSKPILWLWPWKPFCDYDHENQWHFNKSWDMGSTHWVRFNLSKLLQCFVSCFSLGTLYWSIEVLDTLFQWSMIMFKICFLTISSACSAGSIIALQQGVLLSKVLDI